MAQVTNALTERQQQVWKCVACYIDDQGYPPSVRDIMQATGLTSTSLVGRYLDDLHRKGYIRRTSWISRGIVLLVHPGREP